MSEYYVYAYIRSKTTSTEDKGTPYYIGKGTGSRAYNKHGNFSPPRNKSRIIILEYGLTEVGALAIERRLIKWWGRIDQGTGILRNHTDGGDGAPNLSEASKCEKSKKIKQWIKNKGHPRGMLNKRHSEKTRELFSEQRTGINSPTFGITRNDLAERNRTRDIQTKQLCINKQLITKAQNIVTKSGFISLEEFVSTIDTSKTWNAFQLYEQLRPHNMTIRQFMWVLDIAHFEYQRPNDYQVLKYHRLSA